jgi:two-component system chemotaxis sensor kinase CheA
MSGDFLDSFLDDYYAECEEHLATIRRGLLSLEGSVGQPRPDAALIEELFRSFHSVKGISGMVEHRESELLAHEMESYLRALREGEARLTTHAVETLIAGVRALEGVIASHRAKSAPADPTAVLGSLRALVTGPPAALLPPAVPAGDSVTIWKCVFTPSAELAARGINVDLVRARLRSTGDILRAVPIVGEGGAVSFEFLFSGALDETTLEAWRGDGMTCSGEESPAAAGDPEPVRAGGGERQGGSADAAVL